MSSLQKSELEHKERIADAKARGDHSASPKLVNADYLKALGQFIDEFPTHLSFPELRFVLQRHQDHLVASVACKADCDKIS